MPSRGSEPTAPAPGAPGAAGSRARRRRSAAGRRFPAAVSGAFPRGVFLRGAFLLAAFLPGAASPATASGTASAPGSVPESPRAQEGRPPDRRPQDRRLQDRRPQDRRPRDHPPAGEAPAPAAATVPADDPRGESAPAEAAAAVRALPQPPPVSPSADELRRMPREARVAALDARSWEIRAEPVGPEGISVDGWLDEPDWERAIPVGDFYERETREGLPSTETTVVRVLYDEENLYFGFWCTLEDAERHRPRTMFRDENIASDDAVAIMLDAYNDRRSAVFLATNANGIVFDMSQNGQDARTRNLDWDTVWESRGRHLPGGWTAEVRVPLKSLRFRAPAPGQPAVFGVGFKRNIPMKTEEVYWPFVGNDSTWYRPAELGELRGLEGIRPGRNVEIRPHVLGGLDGGRDWEGEPARADAGIDLKWGVTPGLTADFTWNTDFAQEEVDDLQINFSRFSLRFPEKRQIFLEGQRNFQFGERRDADLVFTRRIGLSDSGEAVPILGGGRLSGRQGAYTLGLMGMATGAAADLPGERFTVARVRRDVFSRSTVGAVFTDRSGGGASNRVVGLDTSLFFRKVWTFEGVWARVFDNAGPELASANGAENTGLASGRLSYDTDLLGGTLKFIEIGDGFDPGIGFVRRTGMRKVYTSARVSPRPRAPWLRQMHFQANLQRITDLSNVPETRRLDLSGQATLESGDEFEFEVSDARETTTYDYAIGEVPVPAGDYPFRRYSFSVNTYRRRYASVRAGYEFGGFWGGERDEWSVGANYRVNRNFGLNGSYAHNRLRLPGGDFDTHLFSTRMRVAFRNDLVLLGLFQFNHATGDLASNVRFNWIPKPGTDVFVVYTELDEWHDAFFVRNRSLSVKLNYLFRL